MNEMALNLAAEGDPRRLAVMELVVPEQTGAIDGMAGAETLVVIGEVEVTSVAVRVRVINTVYIAPAVAKQILPGTLGGVITLTKKAW